MPKTAEEMFEEIGYFLRDNDNYLFRYFKDYDNVFIFWKDEQEFYKTGIYDSAADPITLDEFKAITQQLKELGWLDE